MKNMKKFIPDFKDHFVSTEKKIEKSSDSDSDPLFQITKTGYDWDEENVKKFKNIGELCKFIDENGGRVVIQRPYDKNDYGKFDYILEIYDDYRE